MHRSLFWFGLLCDIVLRARNEFSCVYIMVWRTVLSNRISQMCFLVKGREVVDGRKHLIAGERVCTANKRRSTQKT